jgi:hypothetical protein
LTIKVQHLCASVELCTDCFEVGVSFDSEEPFNQGISLGCAPLTGGGFGA